MSGWTIGYLGEIVALVPEGQVVLGSLHCGWLLSLVPLGAVEADGLHSLLRGAAAQ